jgi:hypothetical protein
MEYGMFKRLTLLSLLLVAAGAQYGCGYLAAAGVGAAVGAEAANDDDE